jgi:uncharacterized protein YecE (DUF72 family)
MLPRTRKQAAELARNHDERLDERSWFQVRQDAAMRHAIEIRHESFVNEEFIKLLRRHGVGLVVADTVEWPLLMDLTSSFVYCRLHGSEELYASGYDAEAHRDLGAGRRGLRWQKGEQARRSKTNAA